MLVNVDAQILQRLNELPDAKPAGGINFARRQGGHFDHFGVACCALRYFEPDSGP